MTKGRGAFGQRCAIWAWSTSCAVLKDKNPWMKTRSTFSCAFTILEHPPNLGKDSFVWNVSFNSWPAHGSRVFNHDAQELRQTSCK